MKRNLSRGIIKTLDFGSFPGLILFSTDHTCDEIVAEMKKQKMWAWMKAAESCREIMEQKSWSAFKREIDGKIYFLLFIPERFDFNDTDHYVKLAHEILHLCSFNLRDILDRDREYEADAYTHTHIMRQALTAMKK